MSILFNQYKQGCNPEINKYLFTNFKFTNLHCMGMGGPGDIIPQAIAQFRSQPGGAVIGTIGVVVGGSVTTEVGTGAGGTFGVGAGSLGL